MADLITVRIPALPEQIGISLNDRFPLWVQAINKTKQVTIAQLRTMIMEGLTSSVPPIQINGGYQVTVTETEAGGQTFVIPQLAGKFFNLRRQGSGFYSLNKWEILDAGGFKLTTPGDVLVLGEAFEIEVANYVNAPGAGGGGGSFGFAGVRQITLSDTLLAADEGKLIQVRAQTSVITITLPDVSIVTENSIWPIEALINNSYQAKIVTQGGQNIYFNNTSQSSIYLGVSELIWLFAGSDGWYIVNYRGNHFDVGEIAAKYKGGLNEVLLDGTIKDRAKFPRLWEFVQSLGSSLVTESAWNLVSIAMSNPTRSVPFPNRGFFSSGDNSTTFRVPDLRGSALRGTKASDPDRVPNIAGGFHDDMFKAHNHTVIARAVDDAGVGHLVGGGNTSGNPTGNIDGTFVTNDGGGGGSETRMQNIGVNWYMKF